MTVINLKAEILDKKNNTSLEDLKFNWRYGYIISLYEKLGFTCKIIEFSTYAYILVSDSKDNFDNISFVVYLNTRDNPIDLKEATSILKLFEEKISSEYKCNKFILLSPEGYTDENVFELENFNINIEDEKYINELNMHIKLNKPYIYLFSHNKKSYETIYNSWEQDNKTCIIQATGTGKSYVIAKILSDFNNKSSLILAPTQYILNQYKDDFKFLEKNTIFMTYTKLISLSNKEFLEITNFNPSVIIMDEFHRTGANEWEKGIKKLLDACKKSYILGASATPIRYLDGNRDMSKELFNNNISSQLSITAAIIKQILPMPKYIVALYNIEHELYKIENYPYKNPISAVDKNILFELLLKFKEDYSMENCITKIFEKHITTERKFIVFCNSIEEINVLAPVFIKSFNNLCKENQYVNSYYVYHNSNIDSNLELNNFIKSSSNNFDILFSINKLNEGIHAKDTHGVILLRKTESPIIFYQQIGRAMQVDSEKTPLIFDFVDNINNIKTNNFINDLRVEFENIKKKGITIIFQVKVLRAIFLIFQMRRLI